MKYGEYLVTIAGCAVCHTQREGGKAGPRLAGGEIFKTPAGTAVSANISPDPETGIGRWTEHDFIDKFYQYRVYVKEGSPKVGLEAFTMMPWLGFSQLSPEELGAVYTYLQAQKPLYHAVETHPVATGL